MTCVHVKHAGLCLEQVALDVGGKEVTVAHALLHPVGEFVSRYHRTGELSSQSDASNEVLPRWLLPP